MMASRSPIALIASTGLMICATASAQINVDIPLAVGFPAPGLPSATVVSLATPTTNDYSVKAMVGTIAGPGITAANNTVLWRVGTVAELVARTGSTLAGLPSGVTLSNIETPTVNNVGTIVFTGTLVGGPDVVATNNRAIFSGRPRSLHLVARTGNQAPAQIDGVRFASFDAPRVGDNDQIVFLGTVAGPQITFNNNQVVVAGNASQLNTVARTGTVVPGIPGAQFALLGDPVMSPQGIIAFTGILQNFIGGVSSTNDVGVWKGTPDNMQLSDRAGQWVPYLTQAGIVDSFSPTSINEDNDVGFTAFLTPRLDNNAPNTLLVIRRGTTGALIPIAQSAQWLAPGVQIGSIGTPRMSGQDNVSFIATLMGSGVNNTNNTALFMRLAGELSMIARKGYQAPECPTGVRFGDFSGVIVNRNGRVSFVCRLVGTGVDSTNDRALFSWDRLAGIKLVVRTGNSALLSPTDTRQVGSIAVVMDSGNQDGRPTSLGDDGVLVFQTAFTDGSTAVAARNINRALADIVGAGGMPPSDGIVDGDDIIAFINSFGAGESTADIVNGSGQEPPDGIVDGSDFIAFINAFAEGV